MVMSVRPEDSPPPIFRHSAAWSFAAGAFGVVGVVYAFGAAIADARKLAMVVPLVIAAPLAVTGIAYGAWLAWRLSSLGASLLAGIGVAMSVIALALAIALALVVRW
jgi:hypothetical protein